MCNNPRLNTQKLFSIMADTIDGVTVDKIKNSIKKLVNLVELKGWRT